MEYQHWWSARQSTARFGHDICDAWASEYSAGVELDPEDLVVVDPGNGFSYLFDLAGTMRLWSRPSVAGWDKPQTPTTRGAREQASPFG